MLIFTFFKNSYSLIVLAGGARAFRAREHEAKKERDSAKKSESAELERKNP
jgi:hypothetical protein